MKRNILSVLIPALLLPASLVVGFAHAAEVYNKAGNKIDLNGEIHALHYFAHDKDSGDDGDQSLIRLGINGETQINSELSGYGQWQYQFSANNAEGDTSGSGTRIAFAGLKYGKIGSLDYGRNYGVVYDITSYTDVLPEFGSDGPNGTYINDEFMQNRANGLLTYRNSDFFGLVDGLNFALQYQGANRQNAEDKKAATSNGDGFAASISYDSPIGISIGGALSTSKRTLEQDKMLFGKGRQAETYSAGVKYDANNIYLAAQYTQTYNATYVNSNSIEDDGGKGFANKANNIEVVAQYHFDFGLTPSVAYLQSTGHDLINNTNGVNYGSQDLLKYVDVALNYDFNKNMTAFVDYKINLLKNSEFADTIGLRTDNIVALGFVYQF